MKTNFLKFFGFALALMLLVALPIASFAAGHGGDSAPAIGGIRIEFILFALTLFGVAIFHHHTMKVALSGLAAILIFKFVFADGFSLMHHLVGTNPIVDQLINKDLRQGEWSTILNLLGLLLGFAVLAKHFEESGVPDIIPKFLPGGWQGPFILLILVAVISSFLDNIAAAIIGGTIAMVIFKNKVHIGYIAAIVAASNAGGSGSVVGDTTTTMMWIDGVSPINVLHAYIAAVVALVVCAWFAAHQQFKCQPLIKTEVVANIDWGKLGIVFMMLVGAIVSNFVYDMPALGVWVALLIGTTFRKTPWHEVTGSIQGTIFLLSLVMAASLMPVNDLPAASWQTAFSLGFISAVFDNIPLTKLCLEQGCYDWGMLAYAVGYGGSMIWFGSSAGVAITNKFPEARNVGLWLRKGWHVTLAYILGFFVLLMTWGWEPADSKSKKASECVSCENPEAHHVSPATENHNADSLNIK